MLIKRGAFMSINLNVIPDYIYNDTRLSIKDWGMIGYLIHIDLASTTPTLKDLALTFKNDGIDSIRATINHLEEYGYLTRTKKRWILNIEYDDKLDVRAKIILHFKTDKIAKTQFWTNAELNRLQPEMLKLENIYNFSIVYSAFNYVIKRIPNNNVNDRVAYVIKAMQNSCKAISDSIIKNDNETNNDDMIDKIKKLEKNYETL